MEKKLKKYVLAGAGLRGLLMYARPMTTDFKQYVKLVGIYDINYQRSMVISKQCGDVPVFKDFCEMLDICEPDVVIVATVDRFHHEYIIKALEAGCDVISDKPLTIDEDKCNAIRKAEIETGRNVTVTFNCRFMSYVARIKELLNENVIGRIMNVDMEWLLDRSHGADYFRRWHRKLENSGGLLVHKASHHFDMINWWIDEEPKKVYSVGKLNFYGAKRENRGERCLTCEYKNTCEFYLDITSDEETKSLYYDVEQEDNYYRDRCVFSDDIDIYDNMSVCAEYTNDVLLTYSLIAYSPYEGFKVSISGTEGRLEFEKFYSGQRKGEPTDEIRVYLNGGEVVKYTLPKILGLHGGGDEKLQRMLFVGDIEDELEQVAGSWHGIMSSLIGIAANISIKNDGKPVTIDSLIDQDLKG